MCTFLGPGSASTLTPYERHSAKVSPAIKTPLQSATRTISSWSSPRSHPLPFSVTERGSPETLRIVMPCFCRRTSGRDKVYTPGSIIIVLPTVICSPAARISSAFATRTILPEGGGRGDGFANQAGVVCPGQQTGPPASSATQMKARGGFISHFWLELRKALERALDRPCQSLP